jgi:hypothetical protein
VAIGVGPFLCASNLDFSIFSKSKSFLLPGA